MESTPDDVVSDPPSCAASSAICSDDRVVVPSSIMAAVKFARPGLPAGFAPLPVLSTRLADTIGRPGLSFTSTVRPFGSVNDFGTGTASGREGPGVGGLLRQASSALTDSPLDALSGAAVLFGGSGSSCFWPGTA